VKADCPAVEIWQSINKPRKQKGKKMENKKDYPRSCLIAKDDKGRVSGGGQWDNGVKIYLNNIHREGAWMVADVATPTLETYPDANGGTKFKSRTCGIVQYNDEIAKIVIEMEEGNKISMDGTSSKFTAKTTRKEFRKLDWSGRTYGAPNPYRNDINIGESAEQINPAVLADEILI
jgi:hypothetical protein